MSSLEFFSKLYNQRIVGYNDYIIRHIVDNGSLWAKSICTHIVNHIKNGEEFIDIGANIGLVSLGVNTLAKEKGINIETVHCFECNTLTSLFLTENMNTLGDKCKVYTCALADKPKLCLMSINKYNQGANFIYKTVDYKQVSNYMYEFIESHNVYDKTNYIPCISLDSIQYQFKKVGVIKIDVEGFEYLVLVGAKELIMKHRPVIIVEIFDCNLDIVLSFLHNVLKYECTIIEAQDYLCIPLSI